MNMKRLSVAVLIAAAFGFGLTACGGSSQTKTVTQTTSTEAAPPPTTPITPQAAPPATTTQAAPPATTPTPTKYPPALEQGFLNGFEQGGGSPAQAQCVLSQLEANVPLSTIATYKAGSAPQWLLDAVHACAGGSTA